MTISISAAFLALRKVRTLLPEHYLLLAVLPEHYLLLAILRTVRRLKPGLFYLHLGRRFLCTRPKLFLLLGLRLLKGAMG